MTVRVASNELDVTGGESRADNVATAVVVTVPSSVLVVAISVA